MALPTLGVLDKDAAPQTINTLASGRQAAASSAAVALSNEDFAVIDGLETLLTTINTTLGSPLQAGTVTVASHAVTNAGTFAVQAASTVADGANVVEGATTGAAVVTDANGTLQQYLRGLVKLLITSGTIILGAGTNAIGKLAANAGVNIGVTDHATTGFGSGSKAVTTAGTDLAIATSTPAKWVIVQAKVTNTNSVAVGAAGVDVATDGIRLEPGDAVTIFCDNLTDIFVDSLVNGEGVRFAYGT